MMVKKIRLDDQLINLHGNHVVKKRGYLQMIYRRSCRAGKVISDLTVEKENFNHMVKKRIYL